MFLLRKNTKKLFLCCKTDLQGQKTNYIMKFYKTFYINKTKKIIIYPFFTTYIKSFNKHFIYLYQTI